MAAKKTSGELAAFEKAPSRAFFGDPKYGEVTFTSDPDGAQHYVSSANGEQWERMFAEIRWVAEEADGGLIGLWTAVNSSPVVLLDNEGTLHLTGVTLVDHFAHVSDDDCDELADFCKRAKLPRPKSAADRKASLEGLPSLDKRFAQLATKTTTAGPAVRPVDRTPHVAKLRDGRLVVLSSEDDVTDPKEYDACVAFLFDPMMRRFELIPESPFKIFITGGGLGALPDGRAVFVLWDEESRCAIYDPAAKRWTAGTTGKAAHKWGGAALLENGTVLLVGGERGYPHGSDRCDLYDPVKDRWKQVGDISSERTSPAVVAIPGGAIAIGGRVNAKPYPTGSKDCDRYDSKAGKWKKAAPLPIRMQDPRAAVLASGCVFVVESGQGWALYDPAKDKWKSGELETVRAAFAELADGRIALFGFEKGYTFQSVAFLDLATGKTTKAGTTVLPRHASWGVTLPDGTVLLVGGDLFNNIAVEPELWDPKTGRGVALPGLEKALGKQVKNLAKHREKEAKNR